MYISYNSRCYNIIIIFYLIYKKLYQKGELKLSRLLLIDGNSILNRAFYGIMGSKMLMTKDRKIHKCSVWIFGNYV